MSYWVYLGDEKGDTVKVSRHAEGGTYALGGTDKAELNVTYNYGQFYRSYLCGDEESGLKWLNGKKAKDTTSKLETAIAALGVEQDEDYWKPTPGNAGYALSILLAWAKEYPEAVFTVS